MARLDPTVVDTTLHKFEQDMHHYVVGQDRALRAIARVVQSRYANIQDPDQPLGRLLFLGPTGSGKTYSIVALSQVLFGYPNGYTRIDCGEFQHSHEISKLIGSPPGYIGHRETEPILTQLNIDLHQTQTCDISLVLFDEIEKASESLWRLILSILDKGRLVLGDNTATDFRHAIIFFTSNLGAKEMGEKISGGIGFKPPAGTEMRSHTRRLDQEIYQIARNAAKRKFPPEFMNRFDKIVVFRTLQHEDLIRILDLELMHIQLRIIAASRRPFVFSCSDQAKQFLLDRGTDYQYGARHLKRTLERYLVNDLAHLLNTHQIHDGDYIFVDAEFDATLQDTFLTYDREPKGALVFHPTLDELRGKLPPAPVISMPPLISKVKTGNPNPKTKRPSSR